MSARQNCVPVDGVLAVGFSDLTSRDGRGVHGFVTVEIQPPAEGTPIQPPDHPRTGTWAWYFQIVRLDETATSSRIPQGLAKSIRLYVESMIPPTHKPVRITFFGEITADGKTQSYKL